MGAVVTPASWCPSEQTLVRRSCPGPCSRVRGHWLLEACEVQRQSWVGQAWVPWFYVLHFLKFSELGAWSTAIVMVPPFKAFVKP